MEEYPTSYGADLVTMEELNSDIQYIPENQETEVSSLARAAMDEELQPTEIAKKAADFAKTFLAEETIYTIRGGRVAENPLLASSPYRLDNADFVYWCYHQAGLELRGGNLSHSIQTIKADGSMVKVGRIGSNLDYTYLAYGDIVFFKGDTHIGIYIGDGEFISYLGNGANNVSGGARVNTLKKGKWFRLFEGHILRHREEE